MKPFSQNITIINKAIEFAKFEYKKNDSFHCWGHVENVMRKAIEITKKLNENIDHEVLELAIIFHDIDYSSEDSVEKNYKNHVDNSVKVAEVFLKQNKYPKEKIKKVRQVMLDHSTPHREQLGEAKSIEGKIIYDLDKSIFITTSELYDKYFQQLYLNETRELVKIPKKED